MDRIEVELKQSKGFTLVETLVSITIVAVLMAIITPIFTAARRSSQISASLQNLRQLHAALSLYRSEWDGDGKYGSLASMGMPNGWQFASSGLPGVPLDKPFPSPCGLNSQFSRVPVTFEYVYLMGGDDQFAENAIKYQDNLLVFADVNCNSEDAPLWSPYFSHRGLGVSLGGQILNRYKPGQMIDPGWWLAPPESK